MRSDTASPVTSSPRRDWSAPRSGMYMYHLSARASTAARNKSPGLPGICSGYSVAGDGMSCPRPPGFCLTNEDGKLVSLACMSLVIMSLVLKLVVLHCQFSTNSTNKCPVAVGGGTRAYRNVKVVLSEYRSRGVHTEVHTPRRAVQDTYILLFELEMAPQCAPLHVHLLLWQPYVGF